VELSRVLVFVAVAVSDERSLPVIVDKGVRDGDVVRAALEVNETVVVVLVVVTVTGDVDVVDPDVVGVF
jgi:hypothetical protein